MTEDSKRKEAIERQNREGDHVSITIFGATGDLSYRKLLPALYNLFSRGNLNEFQICAIGRRDYSKSEYIEIIDEWIREFARLDINDKELQRFYEHIEYFKMDFTKPEEYERLNDFYQGHSFNNSIVYYAVAPEFFETISRGLLKVTNLKGVKIIVEKPFGSDLEHAKYLSEKLEEHFGEENIYRIDHYLGKEMIRGILTIRELNPFIGKAWAKGDIECVQISALETVGVETRGSYYDVAGALKDMVQNHLFQLLSIVALDDVSGELSTEQLKVLKSLRPVEDLEIEKSLVLAQYEGYTEEKNVAEDSKTETFAALKLFIDNERWRGVPFFIRTGKRCSKREIEVVIKFKRVSEEFEPNILIVKIQPSEMIRLILNIKLSDSDNIIRSKMDFCQSCDLRFRINTPEAYERMLDLCIKGDNSWFSKWEQIEHSWNYIEMLKEKYFEANLPIYHYEAASDGPKEVCKLMDNKDQHFDYLD